MKLHTLGALASLASSTIAASPAAIYTYAASSVAAATSIPTLTPSNARLLLADQLGVSQYHSLADADDETLNLLAGSQKPIFAKEERKRKVLLIVENVQDVNDILPEEKGRRREAARMGSAPGGDQNAGLLAVLGGQVQAMYPDEARATIVTKSTSGGFSSAQEVRAMADRSQQGGPMFKLEAHQIHLPSDQKEYKKSAAAVKEMMGPLAKTSNLSKQDVVVVVVPKGSKVCHQTDCWGVSQTGLQKRSQEAPLISLADTAVPSRPVLPMASGNLSVVNTTMPRCSGSKDLCNANTNACSGHGQCALKFKAENSECWVCQCASTKETWGVQWWGGAACQKKDISVQFWLFAGFAIFGTAAVTWAVGMLYSMGDAELPSVLGAGVAPSSKK